MSRYLFVILAGLFFTTLSNAQDKEHFNEGDSIVMDEAFIVFPDSLAVEVGQEEETITQKVFKPNPNKAILYSVVFPGLGQIYNKKYWKLPIVYGGFLGCIYAISWNGKMYNGYKDAYKSFTTAAKDPVNSKDTFWYDYVRTDIKNAINNTDGDWKNIAEWSTSQISLQTNQLKSGKDYYRRYRDMSILITVGVYALCIIDAYVDAQLFDFNLSEDLSLRFDPVVTPTTSFSSRTIGLKCSLIF